MKTPPQPKAPRARVMTLQEYDGLTQSFTLIPKQRDGVHYSVLPRSKEAQEAMIEQGALALYNLSNRGGRDMNGKRYRKMTMAQWLKSWKGDEHRKEHSWLRQARACFASANLVEKE